MMSTHLKERRKTAPPTRKQLLDLVDKTDALLTTRYSKTDLPVVCRSLLRKVQAPLLKILMRAGRR